MSRTTGKASARKQVIQLEAIWSDLLSRQPKRIVAAYDALSASEQQAVITHLQHMVTGTGWHPEQRLSAQAALSALENLSK